MKKTRSVLAPNSRLWQPMFAALAIAAAGLFAAVSAEAGTFTNDFNVGTPTTGYALYASTNTAAILDSTGGVDDTGCVKLTPDTQSQSGIIIVDDLDQGKPIAGFIASFDFTLGKPAGGTTADGFSFNFGTGLPSSYIGAAEEGWTNGLSVCFDTYGTDIGIEVKWNGNRAITAPGITIANLTNFPNYTNVVIEMTTNNRVNVSLNHALVISNVAVPAFRPGRFAIAARTGGSTENCWIDNLGIDTIVQSAPGVLSWSPTTTNPTPDTPIIINLEDGANTALNTNTIVLKLNGAIVYPAITQTGAVTTVQYTPTALLPSGSSNTVVLTFADNGSTPATFTNEYSFVVVNYPTIPSTYAAVANTSNPGFTLKFFQNGTVQSVNSIGYAQKLLAGFVVDPVTMQPVPNTAKPNPGDGTWTFIEPNVINYNTNASKAGGITNDIQFPGLLGTNGSTLNFAMEAITYLHLAPGYYTFGINSDDGFRLTCLDLQLVVDDRTRGTGDTLFTFGVTQDGYYPFRLVYFQATGGGSLEWFSKTPSGQKILINDTATPGFIPAYRTADSSAPYLTCYTPFGANVHPRQDVIVTIQDGAGARTPSSIQMRVNGSTVTPTTTRDAGAGITKLQVTPLSASGATNTVVIMFSDTGAAPVSQSNLFTYVAAPYVSIPSSYAMNAANIDLNSHGFVQKVFQASSAQPNSIANAETMLAGNLITAAGVHYPNVATSNPLDGTYNFVQQNVINYNVNAPTNATPAGNFSNDAQFPGIPGTSSSLLYFALEAVTYLYLQPGVQALAVNSDDGFRVTTALNPHDEFPLQLGVVDAGRGAADTVFYFNVPQAGYYPFRLVYFQGTSAGSLEWFSVLPSGQKILLNDSATSGYVPAYQKAFTAAPYVQWAYPYRANYVPTTTNPILFTLVDGTPPLQTNSIQLLINGSAVSPTILRTNGTNILVSYYSSSLLQPATTTNTASLVYLDASSQPVTNSFTFVVPGYNQLTPFWNIAPGGRAYLGTNVFERGMAYNPATGHVLVASRSATSTIRGIYILDGLTGLEIGQLSLTNEAGTVLTGGYYPVNMIDVAEDGAIYACNMTTGAGNFKVYRWASETDNPTVAFIDDGSSGSFTIQSRMGDAFCVRGSGTNTQIIAQGGGLPLPLPGALLTTTDGTNFTCAVLNVPDINPGDFKLGIGFSQGNVFYGKTTNAPLREMSFDPATGSGNLLASYTMDNDPVLIGPIGVDLVNRRLVAMTTDTPQKIYLYDLDTLSTNNMNAPVDSKTVPSSNASQFGTGAVDFTQDGLIVYVLDTSNGLIAYRLSPRVVATPTLNVAHDAAEIILSWGDSSYILQSATDVTGPYSDMTGVTSPYTNNLSSSATKFYRLKK